RQIQEKHGIHHHQHHHDHAPHHHHRASHPEDGSRRNVRPTGKSRRSHGSHPDKKVSLTLTKADFDILRQWDFEDRKKRLESWRDAQRRSTDASKNDPKNEKEKRESGQEQDKLILKRELEGLTKLRIRRPDEPHHAHGKGSDSKSKGPRHKRAFGSRRLSTKSGTMPDQLLNRQSRQQQQALAAMDRINEQLEKVQDKARAAQLRKTFGRGWEGRTSRGSVQRSLSQVTVAATPTPTLPATSSYTSVASTLRHRRHHHRGRDIGNARSEMEEIGPTPTGWGSASLSSITSLTSVDSITEADIFERMKSKASMMVGEGDSKTTKPNESFSGSGSDESSVIKLYEKPILPVECQETCFGSIKFVERSALESLTKKNKGFDFYMSIGDDALGLGMGKAKHFKIKFFKPGGPGVGRNHQPGRKVSDKKSSHEHDDDSDENAPKILKNLKQLPQVLDNKEAVKKMNELETALHEIPGINAGYNVQVQQISRLPSDAEVGEGEHISKRQGFSRAPRRIWYTPLPLTNKKYYRTNWKKIKYDVRKRMKAKNYWPKMWIAFEQSHPKQLYDLIKAKMTVQQFDELGFKKTFDWKQGRHPDYVDWILEDIVPHQGSYYYKGTEEPIRRASFEDKDFPLKDWFLKPPRYIQDSPVSPPYDQYDFCGYGDRAKPFFLAFTLPREVLHYYAPPNRIETFFRQIPKPPYAFPGYTFKRWLHYPLEQKLPQYYPFPKRFMSWTRGLIGDRIQYTSTNFLLDDPNLHKIDLNYNVWHDPNATRYTRRRDVMDRAWELGFINNKGEVTCTMREFNQNRLFLRDYDWLEEALRRWNIKWTDRQQHNRLTKDTNYDNLDWDSKNKEWAVRLQRCKEHRKARDEAEEKRSKELRERFDTALEKAAAQRELIRSNLVNKAKKKRKQQIVKRKTMAANHLNHKFLLQFRYKYQQRIAKQNRRLYYLNKIADKMEKQRDSWDKRLEFHQRKVLEMKEMQMRLEQESKTKSKKYQDKHVTMWQNLPEVIARRKEREGREHRLAYKYAMIWMENVRKRKERLEDPAHLSHWTKGQHLERTVRYVRRKSGYVHADDFFFNAFQLFKELDFLKRPTSRRSLELTFQNRMSGFELTEEESPEESELSNGEEEDRYEHGNGYEADNRIIRNNKQFFHSLQPFKQPLLSHLSTCTIQLLPVAAFSENLKGLASKGSLKCYVCNSKVGGCEPIADFEKPCKEYFDVAYGDTEDSVDLKEFPLALSKRTTEKGKKTGWHHGGFPGLYELPTAPPGSPVAPPANGTSYAHKTSSLNQLHDDGKLDDGFATCRTMRISVADQTNGGIRQEIPYTNPRIIRTCSFVKKKDLTGFSADGCKLIKYRNAYIDLCYCDSDLCNGSSYMRVSYWMIAASFLVIMAQFVMQK
ncbi:Fibrous sheath-interacting protein 2, partial [Orchesella cincta]